MTSLDLLETMHVRFGTPVTTDLNVIFPPPLNIVSFAKSRWFRATVAHLLPGHVHAFAARASRRDARGAAIRSSAIQPTPLQPALADCGSPRPLPLRDSTAVTPTSSTASTSTSANLRLTLPASAAGLLDPCALRLRRQQRPTDPSTPLPRDQRSRTLSFHRVDVKGAKIGVASRWRAGWEAPPAEFEALYAPQTKTT